MLAGERLGRRRAARLTYPQPSGGQLRASRGCELGRGGGSLLCPPDRSFPLQPPSLSLGEQAGAARALKRACASGGPVVQLALVTRARVGLPSPPHPHL